MMKSITYKNRSVPVFYPPGQEAAVRLLPDKLKEYELDFDFRRRWKRIASVEMSRDVAIFQYNDGTKLYLEVG
ncbi:hypothetical protein HGI30_20820 [Paenibacillus albicereus]|uniref:Uncharacterized protein n=1 Tax=Paenibacillus albicereus TaxID=2726185 RepID=A0A6H2H4G5_9BACL|nr:hypothetical protein [Paenibacillus albicereus]QJC54515.1 hypothetical protein HGI30_20820 [Paenibacillus albicereus]